VLDNHIPNCVVDVPEQVISEFLDQRQLEVAKGDLDPIDKRDFQNFVTIRRRYGDLSISRIQIFGALSNNLIEIRKLTLNSRTFQELLHLCHIKV